MTPSKKRVIKTNYANNIIVAEKKKREGGGGGFKNI
jgi:hypothetical protein